MTISGQSERGGRKKGLNRMLLALRECWQSQSDSGAIIIESVDSICRDSADTQYITIQKNLKTVSI